MLVHRLGGRAGSTTFPGTDVNIECGGQFVLEGRWPGMDAELERYGVEIFHVPPAHSYPTIFNDTRNPGPFPIPVEQMFELERAALQLVPAAARIETGVPATAMAVASNDDEAK